MLYNDNIVQEFPFPLFVVSSVAGVLKILCVFAKFACRRRAASRYRPG